MMKLDATVGMERTPASILEEMSEDTEIGTVGLEWREDGRLPAGTRR